MNRTFQEVAALARRGVPELTHAQHVSRLYRRSLRLAQDWATSRDAFIRMAGRIREEFEASRHIDPASGEALQLVRACEAKLVEYTHPDPYVLPAMPGGSKFMRAPPPPLDVVFPDGVPAEVDVVSQTVEGVQLPMSAYGAKGYDRVLIDVSKKTAE